MPYKVFKQGSKFNVSKVDEAGKPVGKVLGSHPDRASANKQLAALYASEKGAAKKESTITASTTETTTGTSTAMIENLEVKAMPMMAEMKDDYGEMDEGSMQMQMPMPMPTMATSFADLMAQRDADEMAQVVGGLTDDFATLACNISCDPTITDKAAALAKLAQEFQDLVQTYAKHEDTEETEGEEIEDHFAEDEDKELAAVQQIIGDNQPSRDKATITNQGALPDSAFLYIEPGGKKVDGKTMPGKLRHLPVPDAAHIRNAISRLSQPATGKGAESWLTESLRKTLLAKARKMLESANKKEIDDTQLYIWKEDGQYRWLSAYSNNRIDDESEIISSQSHKEFDQALHNKEWEMPELYLWHIPYSVGQADYHAYDESAGFPVAAGHFHPGMDWAAEGILKEGWNGASHGMPEQWIKRDSTNDKVIIRHRTKEITFLPLWAAANKLAFSIISKEQNMDEVKGLPAHKRPEFVAAFGEERVKQIEAALAEKSKEADEAGVAKKEEAQPTLTKEDFMKGLDTVLDKVKEALDAFDTRLKTMEAAQVKEQDQFDVMALLKAKSIIGKEAARVDGRSMLAKDAPEEAPAQAAGVHPVGLINNLLAANEAYYRGGR